MRATLIDQLRNWSRLKLLDDWTKNQIYPTSYDVPKFYGLPKIHKANVPLRPTVSSIGSLTYAAAKYLAKILGPLVGNTPHRIKNSGDFVSKLKDLSVAPPRRIVSFDVSALFTSIPTDRAVRATYFTFLECTYFTFRGQYYKQTKVQPWVVLSPLSLPIYIWNSSNRKLLPPPCAQYMSG